MNKNKPFIHLFNTLGGYYIYDVNTNAILRTRKSVYDLLNKQMREDTKETNEDSEDYRLICKMKEDGFLSPSKIKEVVHSGSELLPYILNNRLNTITLQVTQQCNLRCEYCIYSGSYTNRQHSDKLMSFDTAKKGIDFLIKHSRDSKSLNIGFYGGEPLLVFDIVRKCIEYAEEEIEGKKLSYSVTTNGTIINEDMIQFLESHDVNLMISLDGPKEIHDSNRKFTVNGKGTFDKIMENVEKIKRRFPEYFQRISFNAVIDPENDYNCTNEFFVSYDVIKDSFINSSVINDDYLKGERHIPMDFIEKRDYEVFKLLLSKIDKLDEKYVSKLSLQYFDTIRTNMYENRNQLKSIPEKGHHGGPCIPGGQRLFIDINGNFFPCERVSESSEVMKVGHVDEGFYLDKVDSLLNVGRLTEDKCKNCWAFRFCTLCAAAADDLKELSAQRKMSRCGDVRNLTDRLLRDYCTLKEFGYDFCENEQSIYMY